MLESLQNCKLQVQLCVSAQSLHMYLSWCAAVLRRAVLAFAGVLLLALLAGAAFWAVRAVRRRVGAGAGAGGGGRAAGGASGGGRGLGLGYGGQRFRAFEDEQEHELMPRAGGGAHPNLNPYQHHHPAAARLAAAGHAGRQDIKPWRPAHCTLTPARWG